MHVNPAWKQQEGMPLHFEQLMTTASPLTDSPDGHSDSILTQQFRTRGKVGSAAIVWNEAFRFEVDRIDQVWFNSEGMECKHTSFVRDDSHNDLVHACLSQSQLECSIWRTVQLEPMAEGGQDSQPRCDDTCV
jgi:hypothetical protein